MHPLGLRARRGPWILSGTCLPMLAARAQTVDAAPCISRVLLRMVVLRAARFAVLDPELCTLCDAGKPCACACHSLSPLPRYAITASVCTHLYLCALACLWVCMCGFFSCTAASVPCTQRLGAGLVGTPAHPGRHLDSTTWCRLGSLCPTVVSPSRSCHPRCVEVELVFCPHACGMQHGHRYSVRPLLYIRVRACSCTPVYVRACA
jgi:hypothetical protein